MMDTSVATVPPTSDRNLLYQTAESFHRNPDAAGILQGVRALRQGKPHVRIVLMPSPKNGGYIVACEGRLEAEAATSFELDPTVVAYRGQPFAMTGPKSRDVVCDFALKHHDGTFTIVDVKPSGRLDSPGVQSRMQHVRHRLAQAYLPHRIVTELDLGKEPARQIRTQLRKGASVVLNEYQRGALLAFIHGRRTPLADIRRFTREQKLPLFALEKLAIQDLVSFQINAPWGPKTLIGEHHERTHSAHAGWGSIHDVVVQL